jgi:RHS repeat-associated protein
LVAPLQTIAKNGYLYVYISNESQQDVYFDDLNVKHYTGPLLQEQSYYPFGLQMAGISDKALNKLSSQHKFNGGVELEEEYGVNLYSTFFRQYDPQLGRFSGVDILGEVTSDLNPYQFGGNNPITFNDPTGALMETGEGRMQKGPDGNYHVPWLNELLWNNQGFFDLGENGGQGNGGGNYTHITGMNSEDVLSNMNFGDVFGKNKSGEYGFWRTSTFKPTDRGYKEAGGTTNSYSEFSVGVLTKWVPFAIPTTMGQHLSSLSFRFGKMTGAMYEAGVSGLFWEFKVYHTLGQPPYTRTVQFKTMYIGFPSSTKDKRQFNTGEAAELAADAFNDGARAFNLRAAFYSINTIKSMPDSQIESIFRANVMACMNLTIRAGGYVTTSQHGKSTITSPAVWGP